MKHLRTSIASAIAVVLLAFAAFGAAATPAGAAKQTQDGLVNVAIGDITIEDNIVSVDAALQLVVQACDLVDATVIAGVLANIVAVDAGDRKSTTVCRTDAGQVKVTNNTTD